MRKQKSKSVWHVYILRTWDNTLYTGVTTDVRRRFIEHCSEGRRRAKYLKAHPPREIAFSCEIGSRSTALKVEYRLKKLTRLQKERIIAQGELSYQHDSGRILVK
ncbi:MAG: GIY-YIG nuclease family protein [Chitinivibrionales bacterium]|nr:GIY-YIG nuclease family protein [Chitinivibrionales bacterium]